MKNKIIYTAILGSLLSLSSCVKSLDINDNPNAISSFTNDNQLAGTLLTSARLESTTLNELGSFWGGYWAKASDIAGTSSGATQSSLDMTVNYTIVNSFANSIWENQYLTIYNFQLLYNQAKEGAPAYAGIADIIQGMHYMQIADYYNNVPFSNSLIPTNTTPTYDKGLDVYENAINKISEGIDLIKSAGSVNIPTISDILFKGDMNKWIQLANTIKLRGLLQLSNVSAASSFITSEITKITQEGSGFLTTDALLNPGFSKNANQQNPFWDTYYMNYSGNITTMYNAVRPTKFLVAKYNSYNDPRAKNIYNLITNDIVGVQLGTSSTDQTSTKSSSFKVGGVLKSATASALYFSAAESYFLQSEAIYRGWITGSLSSSFKSAISSSMNYIGVSAADQNSYLSQSILDIDASSDKLGLLIDQKWLALNSIDGHAAFNDYRRLSLPKDLPGSISYDATGKSHPNRLLYPTSEQSVNKANVDAEGNIDPFTNKIFWQ
ncbi:SusD/RagB family nutrient-binding outer membrane lipoprotein [Rhizosphaericola mali]|uniref:SusD/RagB family nutrient-binding outer membrane lipoprotein n=1 Tax=Rhizosphaericola mali TaxID=2545455 RepID=A0A5P2FZC7_9BACT|nr:SusD/RagB family nutrient-binding outer membrane lipoprotein [Rhizosphaericola mali]QES87758.1 SusD/RagB family nutrient-binding outer membrane lipoprotein [Rhizosphaericola mali]